MFNYDPQLVEKMVSCGYDPDRAMGIGRKESHELQERENENYYKEVRKKDKT